MVTVSDLEYFDGDQRCLGVLAVPSGAGPFPGVVAVHEAWGLGAQVQRRVRMLAELGYVALAADIFGDRHIPSGPPEAFEIIGRWLADRLALRRRAGAAVAALKAQAACDGRIAAIGYCFGGSTVLELARGGNPDVKGVVSFHGALDTPLKAEAGQVHAKILVCHGAEDPLVPHEQLNAFLAEMAAAGADCQTICYTGAQHSFTNPEANGTVIPGVIYHERTDRRSWAAMQDFFAREVFA
ncbi:MAG: dienelactone hydrolase family protein [Sphingomonadaceae bacterium]|uniref:dienelactone hydrolase family protein n=1 Tax=Thermaurantiacus sp. TaxID=2820283 RepID=UPI00298F2094|nr:dienelactone hydrolase family protein [Thermaurantiacus sp.]MCS6987395.1 dienelactone hydrolase family protein [Sphingomonadaceae bacterium]MDW8415315.1 dienelactone hydrolase family protein [Thermaurantiacus sp.]